MSTRRTDIFRDRDLNAKWSVDVNEIMSELLDSHEQLETEAERLREALHTISMSMKDLRKSNAAHIKIGMDMLESLAQEALGKNNTALEPK